MQVVDAREGTGDERVVLEAEVPAGVVLHGVGVGAGAAEGLREGEAGIAGGVEVVGTEAVEQAAPVVLAHEGEVGGERWAFEPHAAEAAGVALIAVEEAHREADGEATGEMALDADAGCPAIDLHAGLTADGAEFDVAVVHGGEDFPLAGAWHTLGDGVLRVGITVALTDDDAVIKRGGEAVIGGFLAIASHEVEEVVVDVVGSRVVAIDQRLALGIGHRQAGLRGGELLGRRAKNENEVKIRSDGERGGTAANSEAGKGGTIKGHGACKRRPGDVT